MPEVKMVGKDTGKRFGVGDKVRWASQAGGYTKVKEGEIVAVVPDGRGIIATLGNRANAYNLRHLFGSLYIKRDHASYLVAVPTKSKKGRPLLYWPRVKHLQKAEAE